MQSVLNFFTQILGVFGGFVAGCLVWNYAGEYIKGWLHIGEKAAGDAVVTEFKKVEDKVKSKL